MHKTKKELRDEYKQTKTSAGIFQIRNLANGKVFIGAALNLPGIINSNRFQLRSGSHTNKTLQAEWNEFGSESFVFETLDELEPDNETGSEYKKELDVLLDMWLVKLKPFEERGYNVPPQ